MVMAKQALVSIWMALLVAAPPPSEGSFVLMLGAADKLLVPFPIAGRLFGETVDSEMLGVSD